MQLPLQITFRHIGKSESLEARIRKEALKLERFYEHIMRCRVAFEAPHRHQSKGKLYYVRIDLTVPDGELVASHANHGHQAHEDPYVAIRDAFNAIQRQLEDYVRRRRHRVKTHEMPSHGRVTKLFPQMDYGIIETPDGREIYCHRNSVLGKGFDELDEGNEVRFVEGQGEQGPQASSVQRVGKHHIRG